MNINNIIRILCFSVICFFGLHSESAMAGSISTTTTFNDSDLSISIDTVDGVSYTRLAYPDTYSTNTVGMPELPIRYLKFSVPYDANSFQVSATVNTNVNILIPAIIYPSQTPQKTRIEDNEVIFTLPKSDAYNRIYPENIATIVDEGFLEGDNHIITVGVCPISYLGGSQRIMLNESITITINYSTISTRDALGEQSAVLMSPIMRKVSALSDIDRSLTKELVINPEQVDGFAPNVIIDQSDTPIYGYVVITNRELAPAFDRLIGWKRQKGYNAKVICIEDILVDPTVQNGDEVSNINDDAGKLRQYLSGLYKNNNLKYVLFGGNNTILPIKYYNDKIRSTPTDSYFSDFNGNWGISPKYDYYPEIFVGRLLCSKRIDIENYTEKLLRYEINPGNGDYSYLKKAFYTQADECLKYQEADDIAAAFSTVFTDQTIFSESPSYDDPSPYFPTGKQVIQEMNNRYGFFSWHGHGNPGELVVKSNYKNKWGRYGISSFDSTELHVASEAGNGLDNLTNYDYPAIAYSIGCDLAPFDILENYNLEYNFGASFTVGGLYGGPAFLGNARIGWLKYSAILEGKFVNRIKGGQYNIGIAEALSKLDYADMWLRNTHHLIGEPEFEMWTNTPSEYKGIIVTNMNSSPSIIGNLVGSKIVGMSKQGKPIVEIGKSRLHRLNSYISLNYPIMIYRHNWIPYILPLYLQNEIISKTQYLQTSNVFIGNNVDSLRPSGDYRVKTGGDIIIESSGDIVIDAGFIIESGAKVTLKCKGSVTISGGELKNNGFLSINAQSVKINSNFIAEQGSNLILIKK